MNLNKTKITNEYDISHLKIYVYDFRSCSDQRRKAHEWFRGPY